MNITEHPIYKDIYELCQAIEECGASEKLTKAVIMAGELEKPATKLIASLRAIKFAALNGKDAQKTLAHIVRLCIDAGIPSLGSHPLPPPNPLPPPGQCYDANYSRVKAMRNEAMGDTTVKQLPDGMWKATAPIGSIFGAEVEGECSGTGPTREAAIEALAKDRKNLYDSLWV